MFFVVVEKFDGEDFPVFPEFSLQVQAFHDDLERIAFPEIGVEINVPRQNFRHRDGQRNVLLCGAQRPDETAVDIAADGEKARLVGNFVFAGLETPGAAFDGEEGIFRNAVSEGTDAFPGVNREAVGLTRIDLFQTVHLCRRLSHGKQVIKV